MNYTLDNSRKKQIFSLSFHLKWTQEHQKEYEKTIVENNGKGVFIVNSIPYSINNELGQFWMCVPQNNFINYYPVKELKN